MTTQLEIGHYIFILAGFLGYHVISRVPPLLHTPLMSATNAMSGISLVGSLIVAGASNELTPSTILGFIAVKLVLHWAHDVWPAVPTVPTLASLAVILGILATVTLTSLRVRPPADDPAPQPTPSR